MGAAISLIQSTYSQSFNIPTPTLTEKNLPDQTGKVFLITGANCGVGYEVAKILYGLNGTVYLGCRTESKANDAIKSIQSAHPTSNGKLVYLHLDLSDLTTIKATADKFLASEKRLDWLNNNAGVMMPAKGSKSAQNHELQLGTNILGPFLLTKLLLPVLKSTAAAADHSTAVSDSVRVSWAGSIAVDVGAPSHGVKFNEDGDVEDFGGMDLAYAVTKVANWWLAYEFGVRYGNRDGVLHNAYNPGNLRSQLTRGLSEFMRGRIMHGFLDAFILHPAVFGAYTEIFAGLSPELTVKEDQGGYVVPWGRKSWFNREDVRVEMREGGGSEKLWDWCERETREYA